MGSGNGHRFGIANGHIGEMSNELHGSLEHADNWAPKPESSQLFPVQFNSNFFCRPENRCRMILTIRISRE